MLSHQTSNLEFYTPNQVVVDGSRVPPSLAGHSVTAVVKGDALCSNVAAASIVAKVLRDRRMRDLAARFPGYGFDRHKGYGTAEHRAAIAELGHHPLAAPHLPTSHRRGLKRSIPEKRWCMQARVRSTDCRSRR